LDHADLEFECLDQSAETAGGPGWNALHQEHLLEHGQLLADRFVVKVDLVTKLREVA